ncbi:NAD(P)-dependent oxidoreductase [Weissella confusa]|jgi:3-hydroxyisobutyrate dehydrogenase and related beta-hydroxyacid dehydrogenases|uniref:NAD(P)-dependent oxidoreductase n=1 Tax=Weissella confusa TaxID=1583 RepID=A0A4Z0RK17_WEICO|nr:NAD(P)-dependent oxidoreductase [Weissella confusa]COI68774.1 2-hydroxy-3-oxopropionate reductase [Streptococcus pneumoniae]MBJ7615300.1 NAD(P)-dependent oxidoreductase [Weissella confusa]MBJ7632191.1 NAD(P)-dependent oxidoreductase [Weissella confusa]MBJ7638124.1 NAD(P)-dependent oxidoreductase [Weissella confusa]MBJ7644964.1 NAD(P)-dependent oxidoreductase [Weissella confusa]
MKIGFIGTGVMGRGIINNLLKANYDVVVYNRTKAHAQSVLDNGATWADGPKAIAEAADLVITMVGYPKDVEEQYYGDNGLFAGAHAGQIFVDMTTSTPTLAEQLAADGEKYGVKVLDAPVSGGDVGAKNGTLTIMAGGDQAAYDSLQPIFDVISKAANRFGVAGRGQHTKMANQIMIAATMLGMSEMMVYAKAADLDVAKVMETLAAGGAQNWSLDNYGPRVLAGDFEPGFYAKHLLKDLRIALDEAAKMDLSLPATDLAEALYTKLVEQKNLGDEGTQALVKLWAQYA